MTKLFSVARLGEPSQPRPAVYEDRAAHIAALVARKPAPAAEHIAADPSPSPAAPEPWWREMRHQRSAEVFGMAARSEFPDRLPLESIIALASLTLGGVCAPQELTEIRNRVGSLVAAGLLQPGDDHLFGHEAVRAVLPMLALPEHGALAAWAGRISAAAVTVPEATAKPEAAPPRAQEPKRAKVERVAPQVKSDVDEFQKRVPGDLKKKLKPLNFPARVKQGAAALGVAVRLGQDSYSASTVIEALILLQVLPEAARGNDDTAAAIRTYYRSEGVEWKSRARADRGAAEQLVRCYREGERIAEERSNASATDKRKAFARV